MERLPRRWLPKAMAVAVTAVVVFIMLFAWAGSEGLSGSYAQPALEVHPGAPWWKYDPSAEVATVWGVSGDVVAAELQEHDITVIEIGPNSVLAALRPGEHEYLQELGLDVNTVENRTIVGRGDYRFDTLYGEPAIPKNLRIDPAQDPDYDKFLIQFVGPITQKWKNGIESMGVVIFGYLPYNSYLVQMDPSLKDPLFELYYVQWVGTYQPAYKIMGDLLNSTKLYNEVFISMFPDSQPADVERITNMIVNAGGRVNESWVDHSLGQILIAYVPHHTLIHLVQDPEISWIEDHGGRPVLF